MAALTLLTGNGLHVQWPRSMWAPQFGPTPSKKTVTERDQTSVLPWTLQKDASVSKTLARQAPEPSSLHDVIYQSFNVGVNKCWSTVSFCIVFKLRMVFIFFLMPSKKQKIKRIISCDRKSIWNSNFSMCKQSWWHRHACSLMWCLWLLQATMQWEGTDAIYLVQKAKTSTCSLQKKFADTCFNSPTNFRKTVPNNLKAYWESMK